MKVAIITRHAVANYGSLLQAIATQQVIESLGHISEIIDYVREDETYFRQEKTLLKQKTEWNGNLIKRAVYLALRQPESIAAGKRFEKAQRKYLNLTKRYGNLEQLMAANLGADVYITGSDQVWGPVLDGSCDSAYCCSFTKDSDKRIAYAASFGRTDMTPEMEAFFKRWLGRYQHIAVRESSAVYLLSSMGMSAVQVIDPTLMFDSAFWSGYAEPIKQKKYVLVYQLHNDKRVGSYAKKVAKQMGLPLIRVSASFHQISREGTLIWAPEVGRFLSYIKNAVLMITDSFHGTAFALNFNTPFVEVLPNNKTGTRNISILQMTGLADRILRDDDDTALAQRNIDFVKVNQILAEKRKESLDILKWMIEA